MGEISTHIIDTGTGLPAAGLRVKLEFKEHDRWEIWAEALSDESGRVARFVGQDRPLRAGRYRLIFDTTPCFYHHGKDSFFPEVQVVFEVGQTDQHYHIPLLLGPYSYTVYRGKIGHMPLRLQENAYGKCDVRLVKVTRGPQRHEVKDLTVSAIGTGDFEAAFVAGENRNVVPTDTMKNIIYATAADHPLAAVEDFGLCLARKFLDYRQFTQIEISVEESLWEHLNLEGHDHPTSFIRSPERRTAQIRASRDGIVVRSGIADLLLLKTSGSSFSGFHHDAHTTLAETTDRLLQTAVTATWGYVDAGADYVETWEQIRQCIIESFARHTSRSVQHTLYTIGEAILESVPAVSDIQLSLPNQHCLAVDLSQFGLENRNEVFLPVMEPSGFITARIDRA